MVSGSPVSLGLVGLGLPCVSVTVGLFSLGDWLTSVSLLLLPVVTVLTLC